VNDEGPVLEEAMENLKEAVRLVRAAQNRQWSVGKIDHPDYRELIHRVSSALAMIEAAYVEARRRSERTEYQREKEEKRPVP
jgi:hypothetical protein